MLMGLIPHRSTPCTLMTSYPSPFVLRRGATQQQHAGMCMLQAGEDAGCTLLTVKHRTEPSRAGFPDRRTTSPVATTLLPSVTRLKAVQVLPHQSFAAACNQSLHCWKFEEMVKRGASDGALLQWQYQQVTPGAAYTLIMPSRLVHIVMATSRTSIHHAKPSRR